MLPNKEILCNYVSLNELSIHLTSIYCKVLCFLNHVWKYIVWLMNALCFLQHHIYFLIQVNRKINENKIIWFKSLTVILFFNRERKIQFLFSFRHQKRIKPACRSMWKLFWCRVQMSQRMNQRQNSS